MNKAARVVTLPVAAPAPSGPPGGPPKVGGVLARERLHAQLDAARGAALWLGAPAGYGKSSLAAAWVRARDLPCVWLRAGAIDAEPASFFAHLSAAAGMRLPVPQSEQLGGMRAFARGYFQAFFAALPDGSVLVIDEAEAVGEALQEVFAEAVSAVPPGAQLIVTARTPPPPALAKARIEARLQVIEADALALTRDEIAALFAQRHRAASETELDGVQQRTLGWPAAVLLTLNAGGRLPAIDDAVLRDYLTHEVWPSFDAQTRRRLVLAAHLPYVNSALERHWPPLAGAATMLARYAERGLFVLTDAAGPAGEPRHVLHPLIRGYLLRHADEALPADERVALRRDAAQALASSGDAEAAVPMLLEANEPARALPLVFGLAPRLLAQARLKTLAGWLTAMPQALHDAQPYVDYWLGLVRLMSAPGRAREHLLRAAEAFRANGDAAGRLRTLAHLAYLSFVDFAPDYPITRWLGDLQEVAPRFDDLAHAEEKAQVAMTVVYALLVGEPAHPDLPLWRDRVMDSLHAPISLQLRARVASVAGINLLWSGLFDRLSAVHALLAREIARQGGLSDYGRLVFGLVELDACWTDGRLADAPGVLERLLATAERCGIHTLATFHRLLANDALLAAGALDAAQALLDEAHAQMLPAQLTEVWHAAFQAAWLALWRSDAGRAASEARAAVDAARAIRSPMCECFGWIGLALAHRQRGAEADVRDTLANLEALAPRSGSAMVAFHLHDLRAWLARRRGDAAGEAAALGEALPLLARHGVVHPALGTAAALAETAAAALAHGVETAFVQTLIERHALPPPLAGVPPDWPHPVRLSLLGRFELCLDGTPLVFDGKVQKRPLELLQAIAVRGTVPVPIAGLIDDLWPELDGDAARKSFDAALHRLRKLLGVHGSVLRVEAGAVHVDAGRVGCDLWVLQRLASKPVAAGTLLVRWAAEQAARPLLPGQDAAWAAVARARHAARMQQKA